MPCHFLHICYFKKLRKKSFNYIPKKKTNPSPGRCLHDLGYTHLFRSQGSKERSQSTSILHRKNAVCQCLEHPDRWSVTGRRSKALTSLAAKASLVLSDVPKKNVIQLRALISNQIGYIQEEKIQRHSMERTDVLRYWPAPMSTKPATPKQHRLVTTLRLLFNKNWGILRLKVG